MNQLYSVTVLQVPYLFLPAFEVVKITNISKAENHSNYSKATQKLTVLRNCKDITEVHSPLTLFANVIYYYFMSLLLIKIVEMWRRGRNF
jgi:hypothetical protein